MSFFRSFLLLSLASLTAVSVFLFIGSVMRPPEYSGGYAAVAVDESSMEDEALLSLLDAGRFGGPVVSESSQWVMLDEFGALAKIPLAEYPARLHSFDPRNDGYAEKLSDFFVHDGKRFAYIPLEAGNTLSLERQIKSLLGDIPFSIGFFGIGTPLRLFFVVFAAASLCVLVICFVQKKNRPGAAGMFLVLPVLSSLAFFGASGIAVAALLLGFCAMIMEPLGELNRLLRLPPGSRHFFRGLFEPYRMYWLFLPLFTLVLGTIVYFSGLNVLFVLLVSAVFCVLFFFSIRTFSLLGGKHRRFMPVMIMKRAFPDFAFSVYMLPFTIAAFLVIIFTPFISGGRIHESNPDRVIDEQEYYAHLYFQASFSTRQLGRTDSAYPFYLPEEDGLPGPGMRTEIIANQDFDEVPPFPLKDLMDSLSGVYTGSRGSAPESFIPLVLLVFFIPGFLLKGKFGFPSEDRFVGLKRISVKLPWIAYNRKNVLLYNNRNPQRILKDA
ncbi:MAG: hypothetical protein LBH43_11470 [Treponema sp.]|jgi:hypothetical protein|nr:hypothetical protein [Treponema sp.]